MIRSGNGTEPRDPEALIVIFAARITNAAIGNHDKTPPENDAVNRRILRDLLAEYAQWMAGAASHNGQGWVFIESGKLPQSREWVNVCVEHDGQRHVAPAFGVRLANDNGRWRWECEFKVIAWQPLPLRHQKLTGRNRRRTSESQFSTLYLVCFHHRLCGS